MSAGDVTKIGGYALLIVACYAISYATPGDVTRSPGTAFTTMSGNGGKFKAISPKSSIYFTGSSVTILPGTNTVRISGGTGGTIDPAVLDGKYDKIAFTTYSIARQSQYSVARKVFANYTSSVRTNYATGAMLASHNTATASHDSHFVNTSNPHSVTALQTGAESMHGVSTPGNMSWSDATRTLTISGLSYYYIGTLVSSISTTAQITTTTGMWFISFDSTSGLLSASQSAWNLYTQVPVATVWWNGTAGAVINERHSHQRSLPFHAWAHYSVGTRYGSGIDMIAPALNTPSTVSFTSGTVWDEDLQATISAATSVRLWYETAAGVWTWTTSNTLYGATMRYVDTPSYTLTDYSNSQFGVMWVYATPDLSVPIYAMIESRVAPHANIAAARAALPPNLFGTGITPELKLLYRVIFRGDETFTEAADYRNSSVLPAGGTASTTAASVTFAPVAGITATNVQSAIELLINIDGGTW